MGVERILECSREASMRVDYRLLALATTGVRPQISHLPYRQQHISTNFATPLFPVLPHEFRLWKLAGADRAGFSGAAVQHRT